MARLITLSRCKMFSGLNIAELGFVASKLAVVTYSGQDVVTNPSHPADGLGVIASGRVNIRFVSKSGQQELSAVLGPYDHFGEFSLLHQDGQRLVEAVALDDVVLFVLAKASFGIIERNAPQIALKIYSNVLNVHLTNISVLRDVVCEMV